MNAKKMIAALALLATASLASASEWVEFTDFKSTRTRAEVMAELEQSQADGSYAALHQEIADPVAGFVPGKTRAQVLAELKQSQADGSYAVLHQEYQGQFPASRTAAATRLAGDSRPANAN
ncbi:DUF4148 domain-containing protein [Noviherbaspirillum aridicola]|uniref:DUF4148 domain-containing protein n=1 Tax=Noviherbaspirillum aridicola TaxID=2849687 RepID=A0ABQ4Q6D6_9BURK|nr:DUF4148 domain-containing protein [Noviherbaspirillum aridicola]GIZ52778.1 hypothetical protein NCCP691_27920 [Noviherbaspirillum aridicola]